MPDEDKTFTGSLVLDLRISWHHVHTHYCRFFALFNKLNGHRSLNSAHKSRENSHEMPAMCKVITPDKDKGLISEIIINWNINWNRNLQTL